MVRRIALIIVAVVVVAAAALALLAHRNRPQVHLANGTITYDCTSHSAQQDYDPRTAGPTEFQLIAKFDKSQPIEWRVAKPGEAPIRAKQFHANTGSIGGSRGLLWRDKEDKPWVATLSFSDIVGSRGPDTIWVSMGRPADGAGKGAVQSVTLTCGPAPASSLNG